MQIMIYCFVGIEWFCFDLLKPNTKSNPIVSKNNTISLRGTTNLNIVPSMRFINGLCLKASGDPSG